MSPAVAARLEPLEAPLAARVESLYRESREQVFKRADRMFAWLMLAQWLFAILLALLFSPYGWSGKVRTLHHHVLAAIVLGGTISGLPWLLAFKRPGWVGTRATIAVA